MREQAGGRKRGVWPGESGEWRGKQKGVLEIAGPPNGENQDWNRKWERFCDKNGRVLR